MDLRIRFQTLLVLGPLLSHAGCDSAAESAAPPVSDAPSPAEPCDAEAWGGQVCVDEAGAGRDYCVISQGERIQTPCLHEPPVCVPGNPDDGAECGYCSWDSAGFAWVALNEGGTECEPEEDSETVNSTGFVDDDDVQGGSTTPLVLRFDDEALGFSSTSQPFALAADGSCAHTDWPSSPWLVFDRDGDGAIVNGTELFGSATPLAAGGYARNGFEALAALDDNLDGRIDSHDSAFGALEIWSDADGDRIGVAAERRPLSASGVRSIDLQYTVEPWCDEAGNCVRERATFVFTGAAGQRRTGDVLDVHLPCR